MSKKMTPCEKLGYKVGDEFEVVEKSYKFDAGDVVCLQNDDGTASPYFTNEIVKDEYPLGVACFLYSVRKVAKLKPAKRALADAIHQNGGWADGAEWCAISSADMKGSFWNAKENWLSRENGIWCGYGYMYGRCFSVDRLPVNHHQTTLSRDEYFTAYPEQVKVEVNNETKNKVEVEMKSESEVTIKVSDWHKNGELPPVGEVCEILGAFGHYQEWFECKIIAEHNGSVFAANEKHWVNVMKGARDFRPLRTERDWAIDEMVGEFINHYGDPKGGERYLGIASKLYDAGYRKEVKL